MEATLARFQPMVTLEVGDVSPDAPVMSRALVEHMLARGYQAFEYAQDTIVAHRLRDTYDYDNILFLPHSRMARSGSGHAG